MSIVVQHPVVVAPHVAPWMRGDDDLRLLSLRWLDAPCVGIVGSVSKQGTDRQIGQQGISAFQIRRVACGQTKRDRIAQGIDRCVDSAMNQMADAARTRRWKYVQHHVGRQFSTRDVAAVGICALSSLQKPKCTNKACRLREPTGPVPLVRIGVTSRSFALGPRQHAAVEQLPHRVEQIIETEGLGQQGHAFGQKLLPRDCVLGITGNEQNRQTWA